MSSARESGSPWQELAALVSGGDRERVRDFVAELDPLQTVRAVAQLREDDRSGLIALLEPAAAADVLEHIPEVQATEALENLEPGAAARILEELPSDQQADLLGEIGGREAEAILAEMQPAEAQGIRELVAHADDTAGGLMITEYVELDEGQTVDQVVDQLRRNADEYSTYDVQYAYVCDARGRLAGVLRLRDLLLAPRNRPIAGLMIREPKSVRVDAPLNELVRFFEQNRYYGVPVVDAEGVLLGVLRRSAAEAAVAEESHEVFRHTQGIVGGEELRSMPLLLRSRRRLSWLTVNIGLNIAAASVITLYQETLESVIVLAVFLPIISDMSGCSGSQAVAVSLRELTLGVARPLDLVRVLGQEFRVGVLNGLALGLLIALVAWVWKGNPWLGLVVGTALALNTLIAVCVGGSVPLVLKSFGRDPALASGPILTTVTDTCGFFLVLGLASAALARLT